MLCGLSVLYLGWSIMQPIVNIAVRAARRGGDIIRRASERLDKVKIASKSSNDFVTNVDQQAEQAIIAVIERAYPDHLILAEESSAETCLKTANKPVWIIDPLDGTTNFIHGIPHVCISIAIFERGQVTHAVVYDPIRDEVFSASRGGGCQLNERKIRMNASRKLSGALLGTGFPFKRKTRLDEYLGQFSRFFEPAADIRRAGAAALDLAYVAAGRLDGFWEMGLAPWDIAAGSLLVLEAGGFVSDFQGGERFLETGDILAGPPLVYKEMLRLL